MTEEGIATSQMDKQEAFFSYFDGLLGTAVPRSSTLNLEFFHQEGLDLTAQDQHITEEEVWQTTKSLLADKAPGPGRFYKSCWHLIKAYIMAAIITLQQGNARKLWLLNSAYLTLILKKDVALSASDYRPISLVHSLAKLVTKVMANRLAPLLERLGGC